MCACVCVWVYSAVTVCVLARLSLRDRRVGKKKIWGVYYIIYNTKEKGTSSSSLCCARNNNNWGIIIIIINNVSDRRRLRSRCRCRCIDNRVEKVETEDSTETYVLRSSSEQASRLSSTISRDQHTRSRSFTVSCQHTLVWHSLLDHLHNGRCLIVTEWTVCAKWEKTKNKRFKLIKWIFLF